MAIISSLVVLTSLLILVFTMSFSNSYGFSSENLQNSQLNEIYKKFLNWWVNVPQDIGNNNPVKNCVYKVESNYIFLMDPYGKTKIDASCNFPPGHSVIVPFLHGWCDNGNKMELEGYRIDYLYGTSDIQKLKECVGPINKGIYTITFNESKTDVFSVHINPDTSWKVVSENSGNPLVKVIDLQAELFDVTLNATNSNRYASSYLNVTDFSKAPKTYQGIGFCICGIIDSSLLPSGQVYKLNYEITGENTLYQFDQAEVTYNITTVD